VPRWVKIKLFADEVKSYCRLSKGQTGNVFFSSVLDSILQWSLSWQLPISSTKACYMRVTNKPSNCVAINYRLDISFLPFFAVVKDLGVLFNARLDFSNHITAIILKSKQRLFWLNKCFLTKDPDMLLLA